MSVPVRDDGEVERAEARATRRPGPAPSPSQVMKNLAALEEAAGFFTIPGHQLRRLARRLQPIHLHAGETVVEQGRVGDSLYLIDEGTCQLQVEVEPGYVVSIAHLWQGDLCGESMLIGEPSAVAVTAVTDCTVLALDRTSLRSVLPSGGEEEQELRQLVTARQAGYQAVAARAGWTRAPGEATVIAVYGAKGGSGRTTIALNLAAELARDQAGGVLLVDLDFPHNQAALLSGLVPTGSLTRASWTAAMGTAEDLREALLSAAQPHPSGFLVLSGTLKVLEAELVDSDQVTQAVRALLPDFRYIIVDLGISISGTAVAVLDQARHVVLVVAPELPSLKSARDVLEIFRDQLHLPDERVTLVLNQRQPSTVMTADTVARALGVAPAVVIGHDGVRPERAALSGSMLSLNDPRSEVGKGARRIADLFRGAAREPRQ